METVQNYLKLTKPGVLFGNVLTSVAGYLFASMHGFETGIFVAMLVGTTLVIASACCINNYLDQDIDAKMQRTKSRPLISGKVSPGGALVFGVILGIMGIIILVRFTDPLVVWLGIIGFVTYVWLYGALTKRQSVHGTLVGSVSGAIPIAAGYVAAAQTFDGNALLLFLILFLWQEPEFYSIALYRRKEYKAAGIPVISVRRSIGRTKKEIFVYTVLFVISILLLGIIGMGGHVYLAVMTIMGMYWLRIGMKGLRPSSKDAWARQMFHASLNVLLVFCAVISLNPWLP